MEEVKLIPCPFCGCEEIISEFDYKNKIISVYCDECPATIQLSFEDAGLGDGSSISFDEMIKIMSELKNLWNRRAENDDYCEYLEDIHAREEIVGI